MMNAIRLVFEDGNEKAVLIGTDVPEITDVILNDAFQKLSEHDVVLGPAKDGGYYLIGMNENLPSLFENMKWSNEKVLDITLERISKLGKSFYLLEELIDIDTEEDLREW